MTTTTPTGRWTRHAPRVALAAAVGLTTMAALAGTATADAPERPTTVANLHLEHDCPGFTSVYDLVLERRITIHRDETSMPIRIVVHVTETGTARNSATGRQLDILGTFTTTLDPAARTATVTGANQRLQEADGRAYPIATGRLVIPINAADYDDAISAVGHWRTDPDDTICDVLAG